MGNKQVHWLAIVASMLATAWFAHLYATTPVPLPVSTAARNNVAAAPAHHVLLRIPDAVAAKAPQPIAIDAALARRALQTGELRVALPDGTSYPVRIERQYTDETGHWNVVGRVQTRLGPQPMVLTFGGNVVFGTLPTPDGGRMRIETGPNGEIQMTPGGGLVPNGAWGIAVGDALPPPQPTLDKSSVVVDGPALVAVAAPKTRAAAQAHAHSDTTPVRIDVLALYATQQVALRGGRRAVEAEIAHLFALANQAHIDSGSRVRLRAVGVKPVDAAGNDDNLATLAQLASLPIAETTVAALRDAAHADLVTLLRPNAPGDATCTAAYVPGQTGADGDAGYSVLNTDNGCGALVFAHVIGHNQGSVHDRGAETGEHDAPGAYAFSRGYRVRGSFATIMASPDGDAWVPYFSTPVATPCGASCGVEGAADDVRSFNLMAPAIAAYR